MSPALARRGLVQGGTAVLGATVAGIPASARAAAPDPDVPIFAALARYDEARAAWMATHVPHDDAMERAVAAYPPRPRAIDATCADGMAGLETTGREKCSNGRWRGYFVQCDIKRIRYAGALTKPAWTAAGEPSPRVPYPKGEARRLEVISTFDAWESECQDLFDTVGFTEAIRANDEACEVLNEAEDAIERLSASTPAGIVAKARWAVSAFEDGGSIDTLEPFVRQVAAFGEAAS